MDPPVLDPTVISSSNHLIPETSSGLSLDSNLTEKAQEDWIQQMRALSPLQWGGGENHYDGPHEDFCYLCGGTMELFGCQTCENCYHAGCMSPQLQPEEVPTFWFCPHCAQRDWHIPADLPSPDSGVDAQGSNGGCENAPQTANDAVSKLPEAVPLASADHLLKPGPPPADSEPRGKRNLKQTSSSARKKSKYSPFSAEVDKALSVLHAELERAAQGGKSEDHLQGKILTMEQQARMQEGQITLRGREFAAMREKFVSSRKEGESLRKENEELKGEVARLRGFLEGKEGELRNWQSRLRGMMGGEAG